MLYEVITEIVALIGPNGAGKTTFFNCLTGMYTPTNGDILLNRNGKKPKRLNGLKPNRITRLGLARTFQNIRLFPRITSYNVCYTKLLRVPGLSIIKTIFGRF